jgi:hypothetical protein
MLIMNETFVSENMEINGISFSFKNLKSIYLKIWTAKYSYNIIEKLPVKFIKRIEDLVKHNSNNPHLKPSLLYGQITPDDGGN